MVRDDVDLVPLVHSDAMRSGALLRRCGRLSRSEQEDQSTNICNAGTNGGKCGGSLQVYKPLVPVHVTTSFNSNQIDQETVVAHALDSEVSHTSAKLCNNTSHHNGSSLGY